MKNNEKGFGIIAILLVIVLLGLIGTVSWLVYDRKQDRAKDNEISTSQTTQHEHVDDTSTAQQVAVEPSYQGQTVTSGQGRFTIEIPQGWPELIRPMDDDKLLMNEGTMQPNYSAGKPVKIIDFESFGADGPRVFTVFVHDNVADPEGTPSEFSIPNNGQTISGSKYAITYTDTAEGLGGHKKGEKLYEYRFKLNGGSSLVVWYHVYADDLNDQNELVDEVVSSIVINK